MRKVNTSLTTKLPPILVGLTLTFSLFGQPVTGGTPAPMPSPDPSPDVEYAVTRIGGTRWFAENLRTTTYNDGEPIPFYPDDEEWINGDGYCYYNNDLDFIEQHGMLYGPEIDWDRICPTGWRVATDEDWSALEIAVGLQERMVEVRGVRGLHGKQLKSIDAGGTNESGFNGSMGGFRLPDGTFAGLGEFGAWVSMKSDTDIESRILQEGYSGVIREPREKMMQSGDGLFLHNQLTPLGRFIPLFRIHGQSIRCVQ